MNQSPNRQFKLLNLIFIFVYLVSNGLLCENRKTYIDDICGRVNLKRIYLEHGESGGLVADFENNQLENFHKRNKVDKNSNFYNSSNKKCSVEFVTCSSCVVEIKFKVLNASQDCGRSTVFDSCGCDYVWVYEPNFEQSSGEQFCGRFLENNASFLGYKSRTRKTTLAFYYNKNYGRAFALSYVSKSNKVYNVGHPTYANINNASQTISTPHFPNSYPSDLIMENSIECETQHEICRISLIFTDFLLAPSSIIEFFDWNGDRIYVSSGEIFRPPVIASSGPSLNIRFYANGVSSMGYKAQFSFILGNSNKTLLKVMKPPDIDCGGHVNNLGGGITMMDMVQEGSKVYDCIWIIKPPETNFHKKTHLYVKVASFEHFLGNSELTIRQGLTSDGPVVVNLRQPMSQFYMSKIKEHVVPITQGFHVNLKGVFRASSRLAIVYAAFNYKECLSLGSDFLCQNLRCISSLLTCDGFDHCGDNSDELQENCRIDPKDRRNWSQTPHFLFPPNESFSDLTASTVIFLMCSFGFIGLIFAMAILMYRMNLKTRRQRQIQDHIETIHAILEEGVVEVEEEIIIPDDPPDYEAPPDYEEVLKMGVKFLKLNTRKARQDNKLKTISVCSRCDLPGSESEHISGAVNSSSTSSRSCQTTPQPHQIPDSPPPAYNEEDPNFPSTSSAPLLGDLRSMNKFHDNIGLLLRKKSETCKCRFFVKSSCQLVSSFQQEEDKYFSDSELVNYASVSSNIGGRFVCGAHLKNLERYPGRNFTTDDIKTYL